MSGLIRQIGSAEQKGKRKAAYGAKSEQRQFAAHFAIHWRNLLCSAALLQAETPKIRAFSQLARPMQSLDQPLKTGK